MSQLTSMRVKFNLFIGLCLLSFVNISAQYTSIPDSNFEAALITLGHDNVSDGLVLTSNISSLTSLDLSSAGISDLTGIEYFTALTDLDLDSNTLTSLDVSANSNLQHLNFDNNSIATINLGTNTVLHTVYGRYNQLSAIDVTQNTGLTLLNLRDNLFTAIDVSNNVLLETLNIRECSNVSDIEVTNNTNLKFLYLQDVGVTSLDISQNTLLEVITLERNSLTTLDVSNNILLRQLRVSDNDLTILDASNNSALTRLSCQNNDLTFLNIQNGNNAAIGTTDFDATGNTSLRCIKVDDPTWSTTNWTNVDAGITFFSTGYCRYTAIPDANFELALDGLGYDDNSEDGQVPTALIEVVTELLVGAEGISDLTGIEDFAALERLQCHNNSIQTLDLRSNTLLEYIKCDDNNMDLLNLEGLQYFEEIIGFGNDFTSFDFTNNPKLSKISLFNNDITDLDLSNNPELVFVRLDQNELTSLDIQNGSNTIITTFNTNSNPNLTCIKVDDVDYSDANWTDINTTTSFTETNYCYTAIPDANFEAKLEDLGYDDISGDGKVPTALIERVTSLNVSSQSISDLTGIEDFTALTSLVVLSNNLTSIDVSSNTLLTSLNVSRNDLTAIDITNNTALTSFSAFETDIASINFTYNTLLESIDLNRVSTLTAIDVSTLSNLEDLILYRTGITSIDVTNNLKLEELRLDYTDVTSLDVSKNTLLTNLKTNASLITDLDLTLNFALTRLEAFDGELESLDIRNGSNTAITFFDIKNNPSLECVFVDDAEYSDTNWENIGSTTVFRDTNYCHYTAIPDTIFEAKLYDLGYDDVAVDGQVPTELIASVTSLNVNDLGIDELTGIEDFIDLKTLNCRGNDLTTIDLSQNTALTSVNLGANDFTAIDVSMLSALEKLYVQVNTELTSIAVGSNTFLEDLSTTSTNIASLDLSNNINLEKLEAYNSALTAIDLSNNIELTTLRLDGTNITELDLSNNTKVTSLRVNDTAIEILDLSKQTSLQGLHAYDTNLKSLNIRNGNNANVGTFRAEDNPNLSCILVDDVDYSTTYWTDIPSGLFFSETYCIYTAIPDANFEAALDDLDLDDITGDGKVPTPLIEVVEDLTIVGKSISDISGIEDFTALKTLNCASNNFTSLNLSNNTALTSVITKFTPLTTLEVGSCTSLETLVCSFNDLSGLYVANNASLTYLECNNNNLTSLDVSSNTALLDLRCGDNSLTTLDVSNNTALTSIWCQDNAITALDFTDQPNLVSIIVNDNSLTDFDVRNGNNTNVTNFVAIENASLTCVHVDSATYSTNNWLGIDDTASFTDTDYCRYTAIPDAKFEARLESLGLDDVSGDGQVPTALIEGVTYLIADNKGITDLTGIEDFVALETLRCRNNNGLIAVDLSENTQLKWVYLSKNSLSTIDLSNCLALTTLDVGGNDLLAVDLSDNTSLENLDVAGNDFTTLDVTQNVNLDYLVLDNLNITSIDLSQNTLLEEIYFSYTALTSIDFSNNTALYYVECEESNQLASLDFSNNIILEELYLYDNASLTSLNVKNGANDIISDFEVEGSPNLNCILVDNATYSAANWIYIDDQMSFKEVSCSEYVQVAIDVYLQGAFINPNLGEESLMRDDLRVASGTYGLTSPYSDSATISDAIQLDDADSDTMVDWIWVELRTADNPNSVIAGKSGILQRDGDIVEVSEDRITPLFFEVSPDAYYIVIKHRNHLSIMTSSPVSLSATTTVVDLVSNSSNIAGGSNAVADMGNGIFAMIAGDYDENGQIQNTDISAVIQELGVSGYNKADLDMNGQVQNSDINSLLNPNLGKGEQLINSVD